jgi:hypothetical protein
LVYDTCYFLCGLKENRRLKYNVDAGFNRSIKKTGKSNQILMGRIGQNVPEYINTLGDWEDMHLELSLLCESPLPKPKEKDILIRELLNYNENSSFANGNNKMFLSKTI